MAKHNIHRKKKRRNSTDARRNERGSRARPRHISRKWNFLFFSRTTMRDGTSIRSLRLFELFIRFARLQNPTLPAPLASSFDQLITITHRTAITSTAIVTSPAHTTRGWINETASGSDFPFALRFPPPPARTARAYPSCARCLPTTIATLLVALLL